VPVSSVDLIFILRVCALYGNSKRSMHSSQHSVAVPSIGCVGFTSVPHFLTKQHTTAYASHLLFKVSTLFLLTFFRVGMDSIRDSGGLRNAIMGNKAGVGKDAPLTTLVLHDGTLYFFILFGSTLIFSVGSALQLNTFLNFITPCYIAITSMMGSRLILKLRQTYDAQINECAPAVSRSIFFAEPSGTDSSLEDSREYHRRGDVR
ncbi:hypothetical protein BDQ17DRAFT_1379014, partial [Cyathus striatus]